MKNRITKSEARAFRKRWKILNDAEREELRITPIDKKLEQLAKLIASAKQIGWTKLLAEEEDEVRIRWNKLRNSYHV